MRCYLSFFLLTLASQACSESLLALSTGTQLKNALSGNTVEGSMQASGRYTEFYAKDGTVLAKDYKAIWRIEGNDMCWIYKDQPKDCWQAAIKGKSVQWIKNNKVQGNGTIVQGNTNNF
jgi:hypothetical protein